MISTWIATVLGAGGFITAIVALRKSGPEVRATETSTDIAISAEARELLAQVRQELERVQRERETLRNEVAELRVQLKSTRDELTTAEYRIFKLEQWVRAQGTDPASLYG